MPQIIRGSYHGDQETDEQERLRDAEQKERGTGAQQRQHEEDDPAARHIHQRPATKITSQRADVHNHAQEADLRIRKSEILFHIREKKNHHRMNPMGRCVAEPDQVDGSLSFNFERGMRLGGAHGETDSLWLVCLLKSKRPLT